MLTRLKFHRSIFSLCLCIAVRSESSCRTFIAPSSIPGAGLGMFAGQAFSESEEITPADIVLPLIDTDFHSNGFDFLWSEYNWGSQHFANMAQDGMMVDAASFGIGAVPNCFFPLVNVEDTRTACDTAGVDRRNPGAGAFSPYHNRRSHAYRNISAGEELFVSYGEDYFDSRKDHLGYIPGYDDYDRVNALLKSFDKNIRKDPLLRSYRDSNDELVDDIYAVSYNMLELSGTNVHWVAPETTEKVDDSLRTGVEWLHYDRGVRSIDWLKNNGECMDKLRIKRSTIEQAGRGAFAHDQISKGEVVAPLPLIHIPERDLFIMYGKLQKEGVLGNMLYSSDEPIDFRDDSKPTHHQLMLNYCMGHRDSKVLLCPYGVATASVNHSQKKANVRLQWSEKLTSHPEWFNQTPSLWAYSRTTGLTLELIALRDIREDEEVLLDYGDEWEHAWREHLEQWKPVEDSFIDAADLNVETSARLPTINETQHVNVRLLVRGKQLEAAGYSFVSSRTDEFQKPVFLCKILDRYERQGEITYKAEVQADDEDGNTMSHLVNDLPRSAFFFQNEMYARDIHQTWSFRHDIRIPDEIFPKAWKKHQDDGSI